MARLDGKQIRIGDVTDGSTYSLPSGVLASDNLPDALSKLAVNGGIANGNKLEIEDYGTGATFSNVERIVFRGGQVNTPGGVNDAIRLDGDTGTVVVWIPAPNYVNYITLSTSGGTDKFISDPTTNGYTSSILAGNFDIGIDGFTSSVKKSIQGPQTNWQAFSATEFAVYDLNTTIDFILYGARNEVISSIIGYNMNSIGSTSSGPLTLNITSFSPDSNRYKAAFNARINLSSAFPNGGRFKSTFSYYNTEPGKLPVTGTTTDLFYDTDTPVVALNGIVSLSELVPNLRYISGVAYYNTGSTFSASVLGVDNINSLVFQSNVLEFANSANSFIQSITSHNITATNLRNGVSTITNWNNQWNNTGVDFNSNSFKSAGVNTPGINSTNSLNNTFTSFTAQLFNGWGNSATVTKTSATYSYLSYVSVPTISTRDSNTETFQQEGGSEPARRLLVSGSISGGLLTSETIIDPTQSLLSNGYTLELQNLFGSLVFPKNNFKSWNPLINNTLDVDYSATQGDNLTLKIIPNNGSNGWLLNTATNVTFSNYRWFLRRFDTKTQNDFVTEAKIEFSGSGGTLFDDNDLNLSGNLNDSNLVLLLGGANRGSISGAYASENGWLDLARVNTSGGIRNNENVNLASATPTIQFGLGTNPINSFYLLIGVKYTATNLNKRISNININNMSTGNEW
jgi:hypothetical protein